VSSPAPDAAASIASAVVDAAPARPKAVFVPSEGRPATFEWKVNTVDLIAVSSRVDNGGETPLAVVDGDLATAWSSKTDDLAGAWVALRVFGKTKIASVGLTVGMTKNDALFKQNVRIAEVQLSWTPITDSKGTTGAETVLVDHSPLDPDSKVMQRIPIDIQGPGIVKITVQSVKAGTRPDWREATISEIELKDDKGKLEVAPFAGYVGGFEPKPRGVLGIVPEQELPIRCLAADASVPRVWCAVGMWMFGMSNTHAVELVSIDKAGMHTVEKLASDSNMRRMLPYKAWLRVEKDLKGAKTLDAFETKPVDVKFVPWGGSLEVAGVTFRQRTTLSSHTETSVGSWDDLNGVLEVKWPGSTTFAKLFDETSPEATEKMIVGVRQLGSMWLVERSWTHGSEGVGAQGAEAVLCDFTAKSCTAFTAPAPADDSAER
jgi:hypothetical protein